MKIEADSRQIPSIVSICSNKKYNDILYSYLQCISHRDEKEQMERFLEKRDINFSNIGKILGVSRQTVAARFKNLMELGLLTEDETKYSLKILPEDYAYLIPKETLQLLNDTLSTNAISTYVYLFNRYLGSGQQSFEFTLGQIKTFVGVSVATRSNDKTITNILLVLSRIGLIEYQVIQKADEGMSFNNMKTVYQLTKLYNKIT